MHIATRRRINNIHAADQSPQYLIDCFLLLPLQIFHQRSSTAFWLLLRPAEGRSVLHIERSWLAIWAAPTDRPMSSSTCCSQVLRGRPGGRFQSVAGILLTLQSNELTNAQAWRHFLFLMDGVLLVYSSYWGNKWSTQKISKMLSVLIVIISSSTQCTFRFDLCMEIYFRFNATTPVITSRSNVKVARLHKPGQKCDTTEGRMSYPERLKALGITTLETRRLSGDLIEVFKIVKGFVNIDRKDFSRRHSVIVGDIVRNYKRV